MLLGLDLFYPVDLSLQPVGLGHHPIEFHSLFSGAVLVADQRARVLDQLCAASTQFS